MRVASFSVHAEFDHARAMSYAHTHVSVQTHQAHPLVTPAMHAGMCVCVCVCVTLFEHGYGLRVVIPSTYGLMSSDTYMVVIVSMGFMSSNYKYRVEV